MGESSVNSSVFNVSYTPEEKLVRGRVQLSRNHPFFGYLVSFLKFRDLDKHPFTTYIPTMAVTSGTVVMYNPSFVASISDNDVILGVLAHEVMHLALKHNTRQGSRTIMLRFEEKVMLDGKEQMISTYCSLYNIAADIVINNMLVNNNIKLPEGGLIPSGNSFTIFGVTIKEIDTLAAEEIYDILAKALEKQCKENKGKGKGEGASVGVTFPDKNSAGDKPKDGGNPGTVYDMKGKPKGFDSHQWDDNTNEEGKSKGELADGEADPSDMGDVDWDKAVAEATENAHKQGKLPLGMEREFKVVKTRRLNLDGYLRKIIGEMIPQDFTWSRPNKRLINQGYYLPSTYGEKIKILFAIDTSGSVTNEDLSNYMGIISNISKSHDISVEFRLITHDCDVHDDYHMYNGNMEKIKNVKIHGNGGTSHVPLFDYIHKKGYDRETKLLISFTDGYSTFPDRVPRGFQVVFVLAGSHCGIDHMPRWSRTVTYSH